MNHELRIIGEFEPDDFQQVPGSVWSDGQDFGRVGVGFEVNNGDSVAKGVQDGGVADAVLWAVR